MQPFDDIWTGENLARIYDFTDKNRAHKHYMGVWLRRTQQLFKWNGLPDTIPQNMLELYLQLYGHCLIVRKDGELYACFGNWGGEPDPYYIPTEYVIANPYLNLYKTFILGIDCELAQNDSLYIGISRLISRYTSLMVECDISLRLALINARTSAIISAKDDNTFDSAVKFLQDMEDGKISPITSQAFIESLAVSPYASSGRAEHITDIIETTQYLKASLFNDLGLQANYNMKRESINSDEAQLNDDALLPLIDDMLECRKNLCERVNSQFGESWSVEFNSAWADNQIELDAKQGQILDGALDDEPEGGGTDGEGLSED